LVALLLLCCLLIAPAPLWSLAPASVPAAFPAAVAAAVAAAFPAAVAAVFPAAIAAVEPAAVAAVEPAAVAAVEPAVVPAVLPGMIAAEAAVVPNGAAAGEAAAADPGDLAAGARLFEAHCVGCHLGGGNIIRRGRTLKLAALQRADLASPQAIARVAAAGLGQMSGYGAVLGPGGSEQVAAWVWEQAQAGWPSPAPSRRRDPRPAPGSPLPSDPAPGQQAR